MTAAPEPGLLQIGRQPPTRPRSAAGPPAAGTVPAGVSWVTPAEHRAAELPAGERVRGRRRGAGLRGPRHAVCLPGCLRARAGPRWRTAPWTGRSWPARPAAPVQRAAGRAGRSTTRRCTWTRCRCWPTARACGWRCRRRSARDREYAGCAGSSPAPRPRDQAPPGPADRSPGQAGQARSGRPGLQRRAGMPGAGWQPARTGLGGSQRTGRSASCAQPRCRPSTATSPTWSRPAWCAPAGPATCCSPIPRPAAAATGRYPTATWRTPGARSRSPSGTARDPGRAGLLPAQLAAGRGHRVLPQPGRGHRVQSGPGRLGAAGRGLPAARGGRAGRRGGADLPDRRRRGVLPGADRRLLRAGRPDAAALARLRRRRGGAGQHRRLPRWRPIAGAGVRPGA